MASDSELKVSRHIKRKPVPSPNLSRYPEPDPADPFAPLWQLRNRSNTILGLLPSQDDLSSTFIIYPDAVDTDVVSPLRSSSAARREAHYRRRSQSLAHIPPLAAPSIDETPSLIRDSSTDSSGTDIENDVSLSDTGSSSTPFSIVRLLLPRKASYSSINTAASPRPAKLQSKRARKISVSSISGPTNAELPSKLHLIPLPDSPITSSHYRQPPFHELDATGFCSEPETPSARPCLKAEGRSSLLVQTSKTSSTQSHSSSYINISTPSSSIPSSCYDTTPSSTGGRIPAHAYKLPFRRHHKVPSNSSSVSRGSHSHSSSISCALAAPQAEWEIPSAAQIARASTLPVITETGIRVSFGSLFATQRTILIFIRHFWCPLCQEYCSSLMSLVDPAQLVVEETGQPIELVVISNGSYSLISKYRQIFRMPYSVYTDPSLALYDALGMKTISEGCTEHEVKDIDGYVRKGTISGITMVVMRALRVGMPIWEKGGEIHQLGGEFILGPGLTCDYAHRMQNPKGHSPILQIVDAATGAIPSSPNYYSKSTSHRPKTARLPIAYSLPDVSQSDSEGFPASRRRVQTRKRTSATWQGLSADGVTLQSLTVENNGGKRTSMTSEEQKLWKESREKELVELREKKKLRREGLWRASVSVEAESIENSLVTAQGSSIAEDDEEVIVQ
ncbi:hypothetical protein C8J56DRAFT_1045302 [Mycena floridula]|nr:hypothetical protein C8J56DRAFT_1045302 [Mycena floridula]